METASMLLGPICSMILGQLGARVIKIEPPEGDIVRGIDDTSRAGMGPVYLNTNLGKESIALDLRDPADYAVFTRIIGRADVLVHNRPPGSDTRLRIDFETLSRVNPRLIVCALHGFGSDGPYGPLPAYDDVVQAICGIAAHQTGIGAPQYVRTPLTDKITGIAAVGAICAALYERAATGRGQHIEVPMFETMVQFLFIEQQGGLTYDPPTSDGGYARTNSPHRRPLRTCDGMIGMLPSTDAQWRSVFEIMGAPEMASDSRYASIIARTENIDSLYAWLGDEVAKHRTAELIEALQRARVPAMKVNSLRDLMSDPHLTVMGFFAEFDEPGIGRLRQARSPMRFSAHCPWVPRAAPRLDADGAKIRAEFAD